MVVGNDGELTDTQMKLFCNMLVEFDGVGKCVILGRLLQKIKK